MLNEEVRQLCEKASVEQDPEELLKLVRRITELLDKQTLQFPSARRPLDPAI